MFLLVAHLPDKYEAEKSGDVVARRKALLSMQRALIQGQEIGDEKLQVSQLP